MKELIENADDFIEFAEEALKKEKWNVSAVNFFRAIANLCDYKIYQEIRQIPKNHNERFELLKKYFYNEYSKVFSLFSIYRDSYNLRLTKEDALKIKEYAKELRKSFSNKK